MPYRRTRKRVGLAGLVLVAQFSTLSSAFRSTSSPLFRRRCQLQRSRLARHGSQLWVASSSSTGSDKENNNNTDDRKSSFQGSIASLMTRVRRTTNNNQLNGENRDYATLKRENELLRETVRQLELENDRLQKTAGRIVIESFEGENRMRQLEDGMWFVNLPEKRPYEGITMPGEEMQMQDSSLWCDELEDGQCPVEPTISFGEALKDRAVWLVGLLALQSCSGFILSRNELLLAKHPVIIYFLTMLVGAGGNAGNQASVRVIRGLALGTLNERTQGQFLTRELRMAASLCSILSAAGFLRAVAFRTPLAESIAVTSALALIVFSSICLGAILPLILKKLGVDPAHSSTTIQVVMDILGVLMTVLVSSVVLDSSVGQFLVSRLSGAG